MGVSLLSDTVRLSYPELEARKQSVLCQSNPHPGSTSRTDVIPLERACGGRRRWETELAKSGISSGFFGQKAPK